MKKQQVVKAEKMKARLEHTYTDNSDASSISFEDALQCTVGVTSDGEVGARLAPLRFTSKTGRGSCIDTEQAPFRAVLRR